MKCKKMHIPNDPFSKKGLNFLIQILNYNIAKQGGSLSYQE